MIFWGGDYAGICNGRQAVARSLCEWVWRVMVGVRRSLKPLSHLSGWVREYDGDLPEPRVLGHSEMAAGGKSERGQEARKYYYCSMRAGVATTYWGVRFGRSCKTRLMLSKSLSTETISIGMGGGERQSILGHGGMSLRNEPLYSCFKSPHERRFLMRMSTTLKARDGARR
jgi:hypothetical protein